MHEGLETENEIDGRGGNHRQGEAVIENAVDMRMARETLLTGFDTRARFINRPQLIAVVLQIMRPPSEPRRDFQNRIRRHTVANTRKNCADPLRGRTAPRLRPFLARLFPVVLHLLRTDTNQFNTCHSKRSEAATQRTKSARPGFQSLTLAG